MTDLEQRATAGDGLTPAVGGRLAWVDRARGLAIVLMVLDHALVLVDPSNVLRLTVTRVGLPLFMVTAGAVHREPSARRLLRLAPAVVVEATVATLVLSSRPGIVTVYVLVLLASIPLLRRCSSLSLVVMGFTQALWWPVPWSGYQPGLVLGWWALGVLAGSHGSTTVVASPRLAFLEVVGRRPLLWYCGHLVVLAGLSFVV